MKKNIFNLIQKLDSSHIRFACFALVWGIIFSYLIIPWQTPDEFTHFRMIAEDFGNKEMAYELLSEMQLSRDRIMFQENEKIHIEELKNEIEDEVMYDSKACMPKAISSISVIRHFPAAIGVYIGILLKFPVYWVLQLGEFFSLLFYVFICSKTLKIMPVKKELMEIIMLIPMSMQQAASINYDSVLFPMCFMFVAYLMHLKFVKESIDEIDVLKLMAILFVIFITKLPYAVIVMLIFILPINKINLKIGKINISGQNILKYKWYISFIMIFLASLGIILLRDNDYVKICIASVLEWKRTLFLLKNTLYTFGEHLITSLIGNFGYLDTPLSLWFVAVNALIILQVSMLKVEKNIKTMKLKGRDLIVILGVAIILTYGITLALVKHTYGIFTYGIENFEQEVNYREALYNIPYIGGLQGRYYIPVLPLFLLGLPTVFNMEGKKYKYVCIPFYLFIIIYSSSKIYLRYFI